MTTTYEIETVTAESTENWEHETCGTTNVEWEIQDAPGGPGEHVHFCETCEVYFREE